jgi:hypothetical protein
VHDCALQVRGELRSALEAGSAEDASTLAQLGSRIAVRGEGGRSAATSQPADLPLHHELYCNGMQHIVCIEGRPHAFTADPPAHALGVRPDVPCLPCTRPGLRPWMGPCPG